MRNKTLGHFAICQLITVFLFFCLTVGNEFLDIPHYIFHDAPSSYQQRMGEIGIEIAIFIMVLVVQTVWFHKLYKRIRLLEGFIPICANCKKIRNTENQWEQMEKYVTQHSLARFSHSICPDCARKLYPELYDKKK